MSAQDPTAAETPPQEGSVGRTVARNVAWNWAGTATNMLVGFAVLPFLVRHLGTEGYGLWILIASMTGYFDLLDLGLRGSVNRHVAYYLAKKDRAGVNTTVSTSLALLLGGAVCVLLGTFAALALFFELFDVPPGQVENTRLALMLIGVNLALVFPLSTFEGTLSAHQRFDLLNFVDIPMSLLRAGLTVWLLLGGGGLVALAVITVTVTVIGGLAKAMLCWHVDPGLRLGYRYLARPMARQLFGFSAWFFLFQVARLATAQFGPQVVGNRLGIALVTPYSIALRLVAYVNTILVAATGVLTPLATGMHAREEHERQRVLFMQGGKYCLALALFFVGLFLCLGEPLIALWIGHPLEQAGLVLAVLMLGEVLPQSQLVTYSLVLGMNKHQLWACSTLVEAVVVFPLALVLAPVYGLVGVAVAFAVPGMLCRGVVPLVYSCRLMKVPLWQYAARAFLPALASAVLPLAVLALATYWHVPDRWWQLLLYGAGYGLCYLGAGTVGLVGLGTCMSLGAPLLRRAVGSRPSASARVEEPDPCGATGGG